MKTTSIPDPGTVVLLCFCICTFLADVSDVCPGNTVPLPTLLLGVVNLCLISVFGDIIMN